MSSITYASAEAFQDYARDFSEELISKALINFESRNIVKAIEGVKREYVINEMVTADLVRRYGSTFSAVQNAIDIKPSILRVEDAKVDLEVVPKDWEGSYLARYRKQGQDSYDLPFAGYIINEILAKIAAEQEIALFQADKAGTPASTDKLVALFDGYATLIADDQAAVTPVLTAEATGAVTATNGVAALESTYQNLGSQYFARRVDVLVNHTTRMRIAQDYRERYGKYTTNADGSISLDIGLADIHSVSGMPDNAILITPRENLYYGYDGGGDDQMINFEQEDRKIKMWMDFKMGVAFGIFHPEVIAINDQF